MGPSTSSWAAGFRPQTDDEVEAALGVFPISVEIRTSELRVHGRTAADLDSVNAAELLRASPSEPLPAPMSDNDWLACVAEEGQTFAQYVQLTTMRSGRFRTGARAGRETIALLPIVEHGRQWEGPSLDLLSTAAAAFFASPVTVLSAARVAFAAVSGRSAQFDWWDPSASAGQEEQQPTARVRGRVDRASGRQQLHVDPILSELTRLMGEHEERGERPFCLVGVTLFDLFSAPSDLFVAGMAAGGSGAAVFSFARYHPQAAFSETDWHDYGFTRDGRQPKALYFVEAASRPACLAPSPLRALSTEQRAEWWARSFRLLAHELCHLFWLDHCIFHRCLMQGSGHLREDYAAPMELCRVCLRKLTFRLGFGLASRAQQLGAALAAAGVSSSASCTKPSAGLPSVPAAATRRGRVRRAEAQPPAPGTHRVTCIAIEAHAANEPTPPGEDGRPSRHRRKSAAVEVAMPQGDALRKKKKRS